jgi:hypothetical protein
MLHIPAVVVHGNALTLEEHSRWLTPAHIMGGLELDFTYATLPTSISNAKVGWPRQARGQTM